jgi:hypothetical protein
LCRKIVNAAGASIEVVDFGGPLAETSLTIMTVRQALCNKQHEYDLFFVLFSFFKSSLIVDLRLDAWVRAPTP